MNIAETETWLASIITGALVAAVDHHPDPRVLMHATPRALAGLAGSNVLQQLRNRIIGDGETDKLLDDLCKTLRDHADPGKNGPARGREEDLRHFRL